MKDYNDYLMSENWWEKLQGRDETTLAKNAHEAVFEYMKASFPGIDETPLKQNVAETLDALKRLIGETPR